MKLTFKRILDWLSPKVPTEEVQEAERENIKFDSKKLDQSLKRLLATKDEFAEIVAQVVHDVNMERRHRGNEKTSSGPRET